MPSSYPTDSHYKISLRFCTSLHLLVVPSSSSSSLISDLSHPPSLSLATRKTMINGILIEENLWCKFLLMASNWIKMFFFCHLQRRRLRRKKKEREQKWDGRRGEKRMSSEMNEHVVSRWTKTIFQHRKLLDSQAKKKVIQSFYF